MSLDLNVVGLGGGKPKGIATNEHSYKKVLLTKQIDNKAKFVFKVLN